MTTVFFSVSAEKYSSLLNVYYYFLCSLTVRTCIWVWQSRARTMCQPARWV